MFKSFPTHLVHSAIPENRETKKMKFSFFHQRHALLMSFEIVMVTYRVTNFLPKLIDMLLLSREKTEFPFFEFPYFRVLRCTPLLDAQVLDQGMSNLKVESNQHKIKKRRDPERG